MLLTCLPERLASKLGGSGGQASVGIAIPAASDDPDAAARLSAANMDGPRRWNGGRCSLPAACGDAMSALAASERVARRIISRSPAPRVAMRSSGSMGTCEGMVERTSTAETASRGEPKPLLLKLEEVVLEEPRESE